MPSPPRDPTRRFTDRALDYAVGRPAYPDALADTLVAAAALTAGSAVADVGSGTGLSSEPLLRRGCTVYGVEPNAAMRGAAERRLAAEPRFVSVDGTAEATGLGDASVDLVAAGQAFHWFDRPRARREFARILRPGGVAALFWNWRRAAGAPFLEAYEAILRRWGTDYAEVRHRYDAGSAPALAAFFGGPYATSTFTHALAYDLDGLRARLLSSSYTPPPGHPDRAPMLRALEAAFAEHARDAAARVELVYDAELHVGRLAAAAAP
jgi:SAM-dependent methyltransferase